VTKQGKGILITNSDSFSLDCLMNKIRESLNSLFSESLKKVSQKFEHIRHHCFICQGASSFLSNYDAHDVTSIHLDGRSTSVWTISPPNRERLLKDLQDPKVDVNLGFHVTFTR